MKKASSSNIIIMWMSSFAALIIFSVIFMLIGYFSIEQKIKTRIENVNEKFMEEQIKYFNNYTSNIFTGLLNMSKSCQGSDNYQGSDLERIAYASDAEKGHMVYEISKKMDVIGIEGIDSSLRFIYNPKDNYIIGNGTMRTPEDFFLTLNSKGNFEEWSSAVLNNNSRGMIYYEEDSDMLYFKLWSDGYTINEYNTLCVIAVSKTDFKKHFSNISDFDFVICDTDNNQIVSISGADYSDIIGEMDYSSNVLNKFIDGYVISSMRGIGNEWNYLCISKATEYSDAIVMSRMIIIITVVIAVIFGLFMSYYFTKKNNSFIFKLSEKLNINHKQKNDYMTIYNSVNDIVERANKNSAIVYQFEREQIQKLLKKLLITGCAHEIDAELKRYDLQFEFQYFYVAEIELINYSNIFFEQQTDESESFNLARYIISNVYGDLFNDKVKMYPVATEKSVALIINCLESDMSAKEDVKKLLSFGAAFIEENFNVFIRIILSELREGTNEISRSYESVLMARGWCVDNNKNILEVEKINNSKEHKMYYYPSRDEQLLSSVIASGEVSKSEKLITDIIDENIRRNVPPNCLRMLSSNIIGTMMRLIHTENISNREIYELVNITYNSIDVMESIDTVKDNLCGLARTICKNNIDKDDNSKRSIVDEIKKFIEEKYSDDMLNANYVAEWFNMKPPYISTLFKKQEGTGLLEYINITRVNAAKKLLLETDMTISEIMEKTGFSSERTFFRVFEKYTGTSPRKYNN